MAQKDWLIETPDLSATLQSNGEKEVILTNGLISRTIRLTPNAATVSLRNLVTGEEYIRSVKPEALVSINGISYPVGGLSGQKEPAYLKSEWLDDMKSPDNSFMYQGMEIRELSKAFNWGDTPSSPAERSGLRPI